MKYNELERYIEHALECLYHCYINIDWFRRKPWSL